jgi:hypothetical protein
VRKQFARRGAEISPSTRTHRATAKDDDARVRVQAENDTRMKIVGTELQLPTTSAEVAVLLRFSE